MKVVGVGAAADHTGGALEQDARIDGERCTDGWRRDKDREGGGGVLGDTCIHNSPL